MLYAGYGTVNVAAEAGDRYWGEGGGLGARPCGRTYCRLGLF